MSSTTLSVSASTDLVSIDVRNLITATARVADMLDVTPLRFSLSVPIRTTPTAHSGTDKLVAALERRLIADVTDVVERVRATMDKELAKLAEDLRKLLAGDGAAEADAPAQSAELIKPVVAQLGEAADLLPAGVREAIGKLMKVAAFDACFPKQRLTSVGTWGFTRSHGMRVRPGLISAAAPAENDESGERLWRELSNARSSARAFVLVTGKSVGLVVGNTLGSSALARAKEMSEGGSAALHGEVMYGGGAYHFQLDKAGSQAKRDKLARRVRDLVRTRCGKSIAVRFDDDDQEAAQD